MNCRYNILNHHFQYLSRSSTSRNHFKPVSHGQISMQNFAWNFDTTFSHGQNFIQLAFGPIVWTKLVLSKWIGQVLNFHPIGWNQPITGPLTKKHRQALTQSPHSLNLFIVCMSIIINKGIYCGHTNKLCCIPQSMH